MNFTPSFTIILGMNAERQSFSRREHDEHSSLPLFALEGIGGSGKSHIGKLVKEQLIAEGLSVVTPKIAGLGDSPRVQKLKEIKEARFSAFKEGSATQKHTQDQQKDKIFRLAMYQQIKEHKVALKNGNYDLGIVDRTPLTLWVYNKATNPENPYLEEILEEGLECTENLNFTKVILFDVPVTTSYARMLARYSIGRENPEDFILSTCTSISAPTEATEEIFHKTLSLLTHETSLQSKPFEGWDFIPFEVAVREKELHKEALAMANEKFGLEHVIVNADAPLNHVVTQVKNTIVS